MGYKLRVCGYCHGGDVNGYNRKPSILIPVIINSRGEEKNSLCHPSCLPKWRRITEVRMVEGTTESEEMLERLEKYKQTKRTYKEREYNANRSECEICGASIYGKSKKCVTCENKSRNKKVPDF